MFGLGVGELVLIAFIVLILFGGRKLPELSRNIGKAVREMRQGFSEEIEKPVSETVTEKEPD